MFSVLFSFSCCSLERWVLPWPLKDGAESGPGELSVVEQELVSGQNIFVCPALQSLLCSKALDLLSG